MKKNTLISKDIIPITSKERVISGFGFFNIWVGMAVIIATFQIGANGIDSMSVWDLAGAIFVANVIIALVTSLTADIGVEHGLSFSAYLRAPFGIAGVHIPSISKGIVASIWFGIQTYLGATAINYIVNDLTGFDYWFVWYVVFATVQIVQASLGIKAVDRFAVIAAPSILLISVWIFFQISGMAADNGTNILTYEGTSTNTTWLLVMATNMGFWSALAVDIPNITRYLKAPKNERNWFKRNKNNIIPHLTALPTVQTFMGVIGGVSFLATGNWNPIEVVQQISTGWVMVIVLLMVVLAQWSTNSAANLIPASLTFVNAGAKINLSYSMGIVLAGIVGTLFQPWAILDQLNVYLGYYGAILSALAGIMICDYYIIRKRRLNVRDLYKENGQYTFNKGINWAGMISWIFAGGLAIYFLEYMYLVGFPLGMVTYYFLTKYWYLKKYPQMEIESNFSDEYLGTTVGRDWHITTDEESIVQEETAVTTEAK
ncbi:NCS1 family transporter [Metabacillus litoralis]|uniref:NCS1 family transporter n=1 Tax=Metabacillus litoralis TaxID=152268 RepID=UPI0020421807|nr:NCS1 family transporter [Metabacillus litoralis]MCM3162239.1 NCS1 family transporter [Metabacillus litoralis]